MPRPWRRYDFRWRMGQLVSSSVGFTYQHELILDRSPCHLIPWIRSIRTQSPSISTSRGLGSQFYPRRPPPYHRHGCILDYHIPCVLRARHRLHGHHGGLFTPGSRIVRDVAYDECSKALRTGVFARSFGFLPGKGTIGVGGSFGLGDCEWSPRFSLLPAHYPPSMTSSASWGPLFLDFDQTPYIHTLRRNPNPFIIATRNTCSSLAQ